MSPHLADANCKLVLTPRILDANTRFCAPLRLANFEFGERVGLDSPLMW
jgi:hypothetical protein